MLEHVRLNSQSWSHTTVTLFVLKLFFQERFDKTRIEYHSRRLSGSYDAIIHPFDGSPKIVEIDTYKPRARTRRINTCLSDSGEDPLSLSSPLPCLVPNCPHLQDSEWSFGDEYKFYTAQSTPRFANSGQPYAPTPAKSVCGGSFFRPYSNHPSYMANTQSFRAKLRSYSAPKQRPETGPKKRLSLNELMAARNSLSGVRMQRSSCSQVQEDLEI